MKGTLPGLIRCDQGSSLQEEFEKHFTFYLRRSATEAHNDQAFAERGNNVMDLLRTVLAATALPTFLWTYLCFATSVCINFVIPSGKSLTRFELLTGRKPWVGFLRSL